MMRIEDRDAAGPSQAGAWKSTRRDFEEPLDPRWLSRVKWEMEIEQRGDPEILAFGTADMDFRSPPAIVEALRKIVDAGHFGYPHKSKEYFRSIIDFYARRFNWTIDKSWIHANVGIYASMEPIIEELTAEGDEIIYFTPVHKVFQEVIEAAKRKSVTVPLRLTAGGYHIDFDLLRRAIGLRTKMLLLCNPHNPVGRAWNRRELEELSAIAIEEGIIVVSDEVYCGLLYPGVAFTPYGSVSQKASLGSLTLFSPSKSFNLTGLKHSLVITENEQFRKAYLSGLKRSDMHYGGSIFGQAATEAALRDCDSWSAELMRYVEQNFTYLETFLRERMPQVSVIKPEATYLAWLDFSRMNIADSLIREVIEGDAKLIVTYGATMGPGGERHVRLNLATQTSTLEKGLDRLARAFQGRGL